MLYPARSPVARHPSSPYRRLPSVQALAFYVNVRGAEVGGLSVPDTLAANCEILAL